MIELPEDLKQTVRAVRLLRADLGDKLEQQLAAWVEDLTWRSRQQARLDALNEAVRSKTWSELGWRDKP